MSSNASENAIPSRPWLVYRRAMIVVAHPDDAEFGFGGTLAKLAGEGMVLAYVICTNGNKGSADPEMTSERLAGVREKEQRAASAIIGTTDVTFLGYGDGELEAGLEFVRHALHRFGVDSTQIRALLSRRRRDIYGP